MAARNRFAPGVGLVCAERDATYVLELKWPQPVAPGAIEISVGSTKRAVRIDQPTDRVLV